MFLGFIGLSGSGKDACANYVFEKYKIPKITMSDMVADIATSKKIESTKKNLLAISQSYIELYGKKYFPKRMIEIILQNGWGNCCISGIRSPVDVRTFKAIFGDKFLLIYIKTLDPETRFKRILSRTENKGPHTLKELIEKDDAEEQIFKVSKTIKMADYILENENGQELLFKRLDDLLMKNGLKRIDPK
jgi:dephospho-CoA kinase